MAKTEKKEVKAIMLPVGRIINNSLFTPDKFNDEAKAEYKVELAFDPAALLNRPEGGNSIEDELVFAGMEEWGDAFEKLFEEGQTIVPLKSGDEQAAKREADGKPGDAYKGKLYIRANTQYDKNGQVCALGDTTGVHAYDMDAQLITAMTRPEFYNGCYAIAQVVIKNYIDPRTNKKGQKFFLKAIQKAGDGEKLAAPADLVSAFKPIGRAPAAAGASERRKRAA